MGHRRQKGKHRKRRPGWHTSGPGPARAFAAAVAMFAGLEPTGVDVTAAAPAVVLRGNGHRNRGDTK
jgi:hypothetical protein